MTEAAALIERAEMLRLVALHVERAIWYAQEALWHCNYQLEQARKGWLTHRTDAMRAMVPELPALLARRYKRYQRLWAWRGELQRDHQHHLRACAAAGIPRTEVHHVHWAVPNLSYMKKARHCEACGASHVEGSCVVPAPLRRPGIPPAVRAWVYDRDGYTCRYCGEVRYDDDNPISIDHVIPWRLRPSHDPWDLVTACLSCNFAKHDATDWVPRPRPRARIVAWLESQQPPPPPPPPRPRLTLTEEEREELEEARGALRWGAQEDLLRLRLGPIELIRRYREAGRPVVAYTEEISARITAATARTEEELRQRRLDDERTKGSPPAVDT